MSPSAFNASSFKAKATRTAAAIFAATGVGVGSYVWFTHNSPGAPDTIKPVASMFAPAAGSVSGNVVLKATCTDNIGVAGVQFQLDGANLLTEKTTPPYSATWDSTTATNGAHSLTAVCRDAASNTKTASAVSVTVSGGGGSGTLDNVFVDPSGAASAASCPRSATPIAYASAAGHICNNWAAAAVSATGGDRVGMKPGDYASTLSFSTYIGQPGAPTDLSDGTNLPVTFECADGAGSSVTTSQSGFQISAKYMTVTGRCFNFVHILLGYSGDSNVDNNHVTFNDVNMHGFRMYGSQFIAVTNNTIGPDVVCQRNGDTNFASSTWCQNSASTGEDFYFAHNVANCNNESVPGIQSNSGQSSTNLTITGNWFKGHNTRDNLDCHVGGIIILQGGDMSTDTFSGNRFSGDAVYDMHFDVAVSNVTLGNNFFGSPVNGLDVGSPGAACNCNDVEFKGNSTNVLSHFNTYSNGINWSAPGTPSGDKSVADIINKAFSGCITGVTYISDVWWNANGACGTGAATYASTAIFTDYANGNMHLTGSTQSWEHTIAAGCGISDAACDFSPDYDGDVRTAPRTPGADSRP